ncbi:hypothetical protein JRQ81_014305 [Phrynocephalus forsythii]|uniref:Uncharacterized protein n=1 Tax=Phrynocephalus forsythii TaxID=171643 RepID=A0A9Q0XYD2_9SAUR|nr:hypothetical protein JRQ81_014305 [Phrynocephalus forsythii]
MSSTTMTSPKEETNGRQQMMKQENQSGKFGCGRNQGQAEETCEFLKLYADEFAGYANLSISFVVDHAKNHNQSSQILPLSLREETIPSKLYN